MQIKKSYSGTSERLLTPNKIEFAGGRGDNNSTEIVFTFPPQYEDYKKRIRFNIDVETECGIYNPVYPIEGNTFRIPDEITHAVRDAVGFVVEFLIEDKENPGKYIIETSRMSYLSFSGGELALPNPIYNDMYMEIYTKGYISSRYEVDPDLDRAEIIFESSDGIEYKLPLEMPFLEENKIPRRFLDEDYIQDLYLVETDDEMTELIDQGTVQKGDFILNAIKKELYIFDGTSPFLIRTPNSTFDTLLVSGDTVLQGRLGVTGKTYLQDDAVLSADLEVAGDIVGDSDISTGGDLSVDGNSGIGGDLSVSGAGSIGTNLDVGGALSVIGDISTSLDENRVVVTGERGIINASNITTKEIETLEGIESNIRDTIDAIGERMDDVDERDDGQDTRMNDMDTRMDTIDSKDGDQDVRMDGIDVRDDIQDALISIIEGVNDTQDSRLGEIDESIDTINGNIGEMEGIVSNHTGDYSNPHKVTATQVGLGKVNNTSDLNKPISTATQTALDTKVTKNDDVVAGTKTKISYDKKGLVVGGSNLTTSDIPALPTSKITGLDTKITSIESNISDVEGDISGLGLRIESAEGDVDVIQADIEGIHEDISALDGDITTINSTLATKVDKNDNITAGTKPKITYDAKGLVTGGSDLAASDIPNLSASKINTGTLGVDRIPALPTSKITDLDANLSGIAVDIAGINTGLGTKVDKNEDITPGTKCKITYDAKGLVTKGANLSSGDIPTLATSKIIGLDTIITGINTSIDTIQSDITGLTSDKADDNKVVHISGNESIEGIKTFTGGIKVGTATTPKEAVINGTLNVEGDIVQNGESYITHAERIETESDFITMRKGAVAGIPTGKTSGFKFEKYNGTNDGELGIDSTGTVMVGKTGDLQPLLTRKPKEDMTDNQPIIWSATNKRGETRALVANDIPTLPTSKVTGLDTTLTGLNTAINTKVTANTAITGATKTKITYDAKGLVTKGADLTDTDIPNLNANKITAGTLGVDRIPSLATSKITGLDTAITGLNADISGLDSRLGGVVKEVAVFPSPDEALTIWTERENGEETGALTITKDTFGLSEVDNTSDKNKPISTATQTALNGKVDTNTSITAGTKCKITYDAKGLVTKGADLVATDIPALTTSKITGLDTALSGLNADISGINSSVGVIQGDISNINTAISTKVTANDDITAGTKCKITYDKKGLVTAGADLTATDIPSLNANKITAGTLSTDRIPSLATSKITGLDTTLTGINTAIDTKVTANTAITGATKTKITYDSKGLVTGGANLADSDIPSTIERNSNKKSSWQTTPTDTAYPTEKLVKTSLDAKANTTALTAHMGSTSNPHAVTKAQVGLGSYPASPADIGVSTATQTALNTKAPTSHATSATTYGVGSTTNYGHVKVDSILSTTSVNPVQNKAVKAELDTKALNTDLTSHATSKTNPHSVTKAQVGLGNVNNTSDASKPISTATQTALNAKADASALTGHTGNTSNPHSVTKAQVGLGNVDNTSDANKPISTAVQTALNAKQNKLAFATEEEAIGGTDNTTLMTPLRVEQAFDEKFKVIDGVLNVLENGEWVQYEPK